MWFVKKKNTVFEAAGLTDIGLVRTNNEDSFFVLDKSEVNALGADSYGIYLIADGMGGHQAGEVASELAVRVISTTLLDCLKQTSESLSPSDLIEKAIEKANSEIYNMAGSQPELNLMGTTVTLGLRLGKDLYLGHVGDCRAYLVRKGKLRQLTEDHSLVAQLVKEKMITPEEAKNHPDRGKILRCLGVSENIAIDSYHQVGNEDKLTLRGDDCLLFCSDGLTGYVSDNDILKCLMTVDDTGTVCQKLIDLANSGGGGDNTSVIAIKVKAMVK